MCARCHRCGADLPGTNPAGGRTQESAALFCSQCGAPQLRLAESARAPEPATAASSTGAAPPPHPGRIVWPVALWTAAPVAALAAVLKLLAFVSEPVAVISDLWVVCASLVALGLYARRLPGARLSSRAGVRVGLLTGVLIVAFVGVALAGGGVAARFGFGRAGALDASVAQNVVAMHQALATSLAAQQPTPPDVQARVFGWVDSPEMQAGTALAYLALRAGLVLLFSAAGGALAGSVNHRRREAVAGPLH